MSKCSVCGKSMGGVFSGASPADDSALYFLKKNGYDIPSDDICSLCAKNEINSCIEDIKLEFKKLDNMKAITIDPPESWKAEIRGIVSGHSVVGTGPLSTMASAITDTLGIKSTFYQEKIRSGERAAIMAAKMNALEIGGTAICGASLRVSEATSGHGMLMVSFVGTAIFSKQHSEFVKIYEKYKQHLENMEILNEDIANSVKNTNIF